MFSRRRFLKTAGTAAAIGAVGKFSILKAHAADDLNWSIHCDLTGPAAEGGKFQGDGFTEYAKWINEQGGIRGRKINLSVNDTTFKVDVAVANLSAELLGGNIYLIRGKAEPGTTIRVSGRETIAGGDGAFQIQVTAAGSTRELTLEGQDSQGNTSQYKVSLSGRRT